MKDLKDAPVEAMLQSDQENVVEILKEIKAKEGIELNTVEGNSYPEAYQDLLNEKAKAIPMDRFLPYPDRVSILC